LSKVQVDTIDTRSGTSTMQIGSTNTSTINIGVSGDTVNIPSGVTIANAGTATGFGGDNTPFFIAYRSGTQTGVSADTWTDIVHNAEDADLSSAYDTSNGRFTPQTAGYYQINLTAMARDFGGSSTADVAQMMYGIFKNTETDPRSTNFIQLDTSIVTRFVPTVSTVIQLNGSSDYVVSKVYIAGNSGSVHGERQYTNFSGFKLVT